MKYFVQKGKTITIKAPYDVESGQLVILNSLFGVAIVDALQGEEVTIDTQGVFELAKDNQAISQGQKAYYLEESKQLTVSDSHQVDVPGPDDGNGNPTTSTETVNHPLVGVFVKDAATGDEKAQVKLAAAPC